MPKGKPWTNEEVKQLKDLISKDTSIEVIAGRLGKSKNAVYQKCLDLGLKSKEEEAKTYTSSSLKLPKELPSIEEALRILAAALKASVEPGLSKVEVQRLQVVATLARTYKDLLGDYIDYRQIETELMEMEEKYERLTSQAKGDASKSDNAQVVQASTKSTGS